MPFIRLTSHYCASQSNNSVSMSVSVCPFVCLCVSSLTDSAPPPEKQSDGSSFHEGLLTSWSHEGISANRRICCVSRHGERKHTITCSRLKSMQTSQKSEKQIWIKSYHKHVQIRIVQHITELIRDWHRGSPVSFHFTNNSSRPFRHTFPVYSLLLEWVLHQKLAL